MNGSERLAPHGTSGTKGGDACGLLVQLMAWHAVQ